MTNRAVESIETIDSIEEKGRKQIAESAVITTTDKSNVVAVQYPATVDLGTDDKKIAALGEKYAHLKQLAVDDKEAYKELEAAIKFTKDERLDCSAREKSIKDPLNKFRTFVINEAKRFVSGYTKIEDTLKAEKKRIDDIKAEALAAQQRLWTENLQLTMNLAQINGCMDLVQLEHQLFVVEKFNLDHYDFGDQLEQAKANKAQAHAQVTQAIAMEKERIRLAEEAAEQRRIAVETEAKRKADEAERKRKEAEVEAKRKTESEEQAKKDVAAKEKEDAAAKKIAYLEAQLAAANKTEEPEPEEKPEQENKLPPGHFINENGHEIDSNGDRVIHYPSGITTKVNATPFNEINKEAPKQVIDTSANDKPGPGFGDESEEEVDETGADDIPTITTFDIVGLVSLADSLEEVCKQHEVIDFQTEKASDASALVIGNTTKAIKYIRERVIGGEL